MLDIGYLKLWAKKPGITVLLEDMMKCRTHPGLFKIHILIIRIHPLS